MILFVYGAYGVSLDPEYSVPRLSLLNAGFTVAIAHVRGGGEQGERWHRDGSGPHKWQGITDYRDCALHLIESGKAARGGIVAHGRSAGGTIVGAAANEWPDLFAAVIGQDPFVDPLGALTDTLNPLSRAEWREWGSPITDPLAREAIARFSPVQNIRVQSYPRILAHVATDDAVVSPRESLMWIRGLRHAGADAQLLSNTGRGHSTARSSQEALREVALDYAWACASVGLRTTVEDQHGS
jgi:oligopeptidase B